jgi:hypothetical protein
MALTASVALVAPIPAGWAQVGEHGPEENVVEHPSATEAEPEELQYRYAPEEVTPQRQVPKPAKHQEAKQRHADDHLPLAGQRHFARSAVCGVDLAEDDRFAVGATLSYWRYQRYREVPPPASIALWGVSAG